MAWNKGEMLTHQVGTAVVHNMDSSCWLLLGKPRGSTVPKFCTKVIAAVVGSDPGKYTEAFLGKPNDAYCSWIQDPDKWGGAIELSILSEFYGREIAAYDIQTTRCDVYGQMSPYDGAPEEFDQTVFSVRSDRSIGPVENFALNLVKDAQKKRSYTDTAHFTLRCGVCQAGLVGQKEAVEHAQATGHVNFQEYR